MAGYDSIQLLETSVASKRFKSKEMKLVGGFPTTQPFTPFLDLTVQLTDSEVSRPHAVTRQILLSTVQKFDTSFVLLSSTIPTGLLNSLLGQVEGNGRVLRSQELLHLPWQELTVSLLKDFSLSELTLGVATTSVVLLDELKRASE